MKPSRPLAAALAALLAACGGDAPQEGEVSGEVLEGTINDAMLPLEQVRSPPPLAEPTGRAASPGGAAGEDAPEAEPQADAEEAPAAEADEPEG